MEFYIKLENVDVSFVKYNNVRNNLKENIIHFVLNFGKNRYVNEEFVALHDISFEIRSGDRLAVIGKNGAGKTTLLKTIAGIYRPQNGSVKVVGKVSCLLDILGGFNPELTGRENIYVNGLVFGYSRKQIDSKVEEIIDFSGVCEFIDTPLKYYSTGMGMRLAFSIATSIDPEILIVDELFAGGDVGFVDKASKRIKRLTAEADIFVAAPHDMGYVREFFNKVLYLKDHAVGYFGDDIEYAIHKYICDNS